MLAGVHVVVDGAGPPVVICTGLGGHWFDWDDAAATLARDHTVIRYDRPGYGLSPPSEVPPTVDGEVRRIVAVLDTLEITKPAAVVGHSLGAVYAEAFARLHPDRTRSLMLLDPAFSTHPRVVIPTRWRIRGARVFARLVGASGLQRLFGTTVRRVLNHSVPPGGVDDRTRAWVNRLYRRPRYLEAALVENASFPAMAVELGEIRKRADLRAPATVAAAHTGRPTPWGSLWLRRMRSFTQILGARYVVVRPAHHHAMIDRPAEVATVISESDR